MFRFRLKVAKPRLKKAQFSKTLDEACEVQVRQAARAFLRAALEKVPSYTGMAKGSLIPLGRFLRVRVDVDVVADPKKHKDRTDAGRALGERAFKFTNSQGKHLFTFEVKVLHYLINEGTKDAIPNLTHETPWLSLDAGLEAFNAYLRENLGKRIPRLRDFVVREETVIST